MEKIEQAAAKLVKDAVGRNFPAALQDLEDIEAATKAAEADCLLSDGPKFINSKYEPVKGIEQCLQDIEGIVNSAMDIIKQVRSGSPDFQQILQDVETTVSDVEGAE